MKATGWQQDELESYNLPEHTLVALHHLTSKSWQLPHPKTNLPDERPRAKRQVAPRHRRRLH
jgi:hypothetical protein